MSKYKEIVAADIMTKAPVCAKPSQDLQSIEQTLIQGRIGGCPVVEHGKLVGVISRSDIARVEVLMRSLDGAVTDAIEDEKQTDGFEHSTLVAFDGFRQRLDKLKVKDAMRDQVVTCAPQTPVAAIADIMVKQHIHRVIVVEQDRPVGIISSLDICKLMATVD
jgi:CBS domain-containing protein